jgi:1,4-alpha-glucan branching enzyme
MKKMLPSILVLALFFGCAAAPRGPELLDSGVRFNLRAPSAKSVTISGSFNRWDRYGHMLSGPDRRGVWSITIPLHPGRYEYTFIIDGTAWQPDPAAPSMDDGFGGKNSVVEVR